MGVEGLVAVAVVDDGDIAVAVVVPTGIDDHAVVGGVDGVAQRAAEIDRRVVGFGSVIVAGEPVVHGGEDKGAGADRAIRGLARRRPGRTAAPRQG